MNVATKESGTRDLSREAQCLAEMVARFVLLAIPYGNEIPKCARELCGVEAFSFQAIGLMSGGATIINVWWFKAGITTQESLPVLSLRQWGGGGRCDVLRYAVPEECRRELSYILYRQEDIVAELRRKHDLRAQRRRVKVQGRNISAALRARANKK